MARATGWLGVGLLLWAAPALAWQAELTPQGVRLFDPAAPPPGELASVQTGPAHDLAAQGPTLYVALDAGGVAVIDASDPAHPRLAGKLAEGVACARLLLSSGALLCLEARYEARAFDLANPLQPTARSLGPVGAPAAQAGTAPSAPPRPAPAEPRVRPTAHVVEVSRGRAIIDGGTAAGFTEGARIQIVSQRPVEKPDLATGGTRAVPSGETVAVITIEQADAHRAMARLGRGDLAEAGDLAMLTEEPTSERLLVPRRAPFQVRAGFHARPFLGLNTSAKPFGMLTDAFVDYYFASPVRVELALAPAGFTVAAATQHYPVTGAFTAAYATDYFEIGLGVGGMLGAAGPMVYDSGAVLAPGQTPPGHLEDNTGFTINQVLRLGALDGINVLWQSSIFSRPEQFVFGVGRAEASVPLTRHLGLFGGGGGGENGWAYGEFGVRTYVNGTGAAGTLIISASLGYVALLDGWNARAQAADSVAGPAVAFGMEWRL